jgi:YHS domain-containing protein
MNAKMRLLRNVLIMATLLLISGVMLAFSSCCGNHGSHVRAAGAVSGDGCCASKAQAASHEQVLISTANDAAGPAAQPALAQDHASVDRPQAAVAPAEQTTCPVRGDPIDKSVFTEYQGKKVYFCCKGCIAEFQKDPQKCIAKLPPFAQ